MTEYVDCRADIASALSGLGAAGTRAAATAVFSAMGYSSDRTAPVSTAADFIEQFDADGRLTEADRTALRAASAIRLLFQITNQELALHEDLFRSQTEVQRDDFESYLFFDVELPDAQPTRSDLSAFVRAINKPLRMPALVLFRHDGRASLGVIHRRLNRRDAARDVLEKVTLIKDIDLAHPIRAHLEILNDFAIGNLKADGDLKDFADLHRAWQDRLDADKLSQKFYREIADWYFWAHHLVDAGKIELPRDCRTEQEKSLFLIRLLTRVIFCWFLVEKGLVPPELFQPHRLQALLKGFEPSANPKKPDMAPDFYHAVLQNLFFGTLNMPRDQRAFREKRQSGQRFDPNYGITNLWRHEKLFRNPEDWPALAARVPFLNGGLFDCLDDKAGSAKDATILDGFSDNPKLACRLPNDLFFGPERTVDLSTDYGEKDKKSARSKKARVRGLIEILSRYKFTIEENTPLEEEIALDPELLGKVFENLLASYNEDTRTTARKALGAFYTPREIVNYMVDEALKAYLAGKVPRCKGALDDLFSNKATLRDIAGDTHAALVRAIGDVKILDPACGSGAFPMGALHRLVDLLGKLDPNNESWKRDRLAVARLDLDWLKRENAGAERIADAETRIADIERSFDTRFHALDYARKLYLIENAIYGIDIQPVAVQIAKLRFFISLVVDQNVDPAADNLGVRPLPNLETRLVAANTLIPIEKEESNLFSGEIERLRRELADIRHEHFNARSPVAKRKWRAADEAKRREISAHLEQNHMMSRSSAKALAAWDPYDQNNSAPFFDSEWMFGLPVGKVRREGMPLVTMLGNLALVNEAGGQGELAATQIAEIDSGFDMVIGNPPYLFITQLDEASKKYYFDHYETASYRFDVYGLFIERSIKSLLKQGGLLTFIIPHTLLSNDSFEKLRRLILQDTRVHEVVDIGPNVFPGAKNETMVFLLANQSPVQEFTGTKVTTTTAKTFPMPSSRAQVRQLDWLQNPKATWLVGASLVFVEILAQMERAPRRLGALTTINQGLRTGDNERYLSDKKENRRWKPAVGGKEVARYRRLREELYVNYDPALLDAPRKREIFDSKEKLVVQEIRNITLSRRIVATYDDQQFYCLQSTNVINHRDASSPFSMKFLLSIVNSEAVNFYFRRRFNGNNHIASNQLAAIPIPDAAHDRQLLMSNLTDYITSTNEIDAQDRNAQDTQMLAFWEQLLDGLVYELYFPEMLTASEIQIFESVGSTKMPVLKDLSDSAARSRMRQTYQHIAEEKHPVAVNITKLASVEFIRQIRNDG